MRESNALGKGAPRRAAGARVLRPRAEGVKCGAGSRAASEVCWPRTSPPGGASAGTEATVPYQTDLTPNVQTVPLTS